MSRKPKQSAGDNDDLNTFPEINSDIEDEDTDDESSYADGNSEVDNETEDDDQEGEENQESDDSSDEDDEESNSYYEEEEEAEEDVPNESILNPDFADDDDDDDDHELDNDDDESESELAESNEKISQEMRKDILNKYHPELNVVSQEEIYEMCKVRRDKDDIIVDDNHKTVPILTKYEKTKILGIRAKQINNGATPLIEIQVPSAGNIGSTNSVVDSNETQVQKLQDKHFDGYLVALEELKQKLIPVIIRRPLPDGRSEYWPLKELEVFM